MYARDFIDAQEGLRRLSGLQAEPSKRNFFNHVAGMLEHSVRFHVPYGVDLMAGKSWFAMRSALRLPFPLIAIHSVNRMVGDFGDPTVGFYRTLTLAAEDTARDCIQIVSVVKDPVHGWAPAPAIVASMHISEAVGLELRICDTNSFEKVLLKQLPAHRILRELNDDVNRVADLCLMLNLANVTTETVAPSKELAKARERRGKLPLLDYKVLRVGGELWHDERNHANTAEGEGYRSHMRRGHIRRIESGREVWVRSTYVQGRKDGFVAKEYHAHA